MLQNEDDFCQCPFCSELTLATETNCMHCHTVIGQNDAPLPSTHPLFLKKRVLLLGIVIAFLLTSGVWLCKDFLPLPASTTKVQSASMKEPPQISKAYQPSNIQSISKPHQPHQPEASSPAINALEGAAERQTSEKPDSSPPPPKNYQTLPKHRSRRLTCQT